MATSQPMNSDSQYWTDLGLKYETVYGQDIGLRAVVQEYCTMFPPTAHILECGSGTGRPVASTIASNGHRYHGIDMSPGMVSLSQKAVPGGTFEVANMLEYGPVNRYDGVVASLSIFELSRQEVTSMCQKWSQWLNPGGLLLINTFAAEDCEQVKAGNYGADGECASKVEWGFFGQTVLITLYPRNGGKGVLEKAGFEIVHKEEDLFTPAADTECEPEPRYYIIAKKVVGE